MDSDKIFRTEGAASYLATEEARLRLVQSDPRYLKPTLSQLYFLRFRLLFDGWHDIGGGSTQIFGVYEANSESRKSNLLRHVTIERGTFGTFDLETGVTIDDTPIDGNVISSIEREFVDVELPAIQEGSSICTNTNYVEVEWMFNRTSRQAGWSLPNANMSKLLARLKLMADDFRALKSS